MSTTPNLDELLDAALEYRQRGWSVLPVTNDKKPATKRWRGLQTTRATEKVIRGWFKPGALGGRVAGVGVICGSVSNDLAVLDFDDPDLYATWQTEQPELAAALPTVKTARGFHVYAKVPDCTTNNFGKGELRGKGAYVVAPPSLHSSGVSYKWLIEPTAELPLVDASVFDCALDSQKRADSLSIWPESPVSLGSPVSLVSLVYDDELNRFIQEAIVATIPAGLAERNNGIFQFARRLKPHPQLKGRDGLDLLQAVVMWHKAAKRFIGTQDLDTTRADFLHAWPRVKYPFGEALEVALDAARNSANPECAKQFEAPETHLLIRLCRELQRLAGDKPFFLDARNAGGCIEVNKDLANRRLGMLVACGVLVRITIGHSGRASEFRYIGD